MGDVRLHMPWYVGVAFGGYAVLLILQITLTVEGRKGVIAVPFLLIKMAVFYLALSYWDPTACALAKHLGWWSVGIATWVTLTEARLNLKKAFLYPQHPQRADNLVLTVIILTTVVIPATLLYFVARVVITDNCAI